MSNITLSSLNEIKLANLFCQLTFYNVETFIEVVVEQKDFTAFQQMDPHYVTIVKSLRRYLPSMSPPTENCELLGHGFL